MRIGSLNLRLLLAAAVSTVAALAITAGVISYLFEIYFHNRLGEELRADLTQLTAALDVQADGSVEVTGIGDLRYDQPFGGRYWQVQIGDAPALVSRSLWDQPLTIPAPEKLGEPQSISLAAPFGSELMALSWRIEIDGVDAPQGVVLSVATDLAELNAASGQFRMNIISWLVLLGIALILAAWVQVRIGLRPLEQIRADLERVARDDAEQLPTAYPAEVMPLVDTINMQLDRQASSLANARRRSGDLAHGLKTPLTVLAAYAEDIRADGDPERAAQIAGQVAAMRVFVERELARSRVSSSRSATTPLRKATIAMVDAIRKLPGSDLLEWTVDIPADITVPSDAHDLSELLGNLLDNARKHARTRVVVRASQTAEAVALQVEDDGPGIPEDELARATEPGRQGTSSTEGQGLGLAIVKDILELQGGELVLGNRPGAGLIATVTWPRRA